MDKGKNKVDPIAEEEERRWLKALCEFEIITEQYLALLQKMNEWLDQHRELNNNGQALEGTQTAADAEESASALQASAMELADVIWRFHQDLLDGDCEASTSGSSQAADQKPEVPPGEQNPEVPPADPKPESSSP